MKLVPKGVNVICSLIFQLNIKYYENILVKDLDLNFNMKCNVRNKKSESAYKRKSKFLQKSTLQTKTLKKKQYTILMVFAYFTFEQECVHFIPDLQGC